MCSYLFNTSGWWQIYFTKLSPKPGYLTLLIINMSTEICESIHCFMPQLVINAPKLWSVIDNLQEVNSYPRVYKISKTT
jgi:hypothetical protein